MTVEAGQAKIETEVAQLRQFGREQVLVPRCLLIRAVVSEAQAADLRGRQIAGDVDGDFFQAE